MTLTTRDAKAALVVIDPQQGNLALPAPDEFGNRLGTA
jgi:hypothetical protein